MLDDYPSILPDVLLKCKLYFQGNRILFVLLRQDSALPMLPAALAGGLLRPGGPAGILFGGLAGLASGWLAVLERTGAARARVPVGGFRLFLLPAAVEGADEAVLSIADQILPALWRASTTSRRISGRFHCSSARWRAFSWGLFATYTGSMVRGSISVYHIQVDRVPGVG